MLKLQNITFCFKSSSLEIVAVINVQYYYKKELVVKFNY